MKVFNAAGGLLYADLSPEQKRFLNQIAKAVPAELGTLDNFAHLVGKIRRDEAALIVKRIMMAMAELGPHPEGHKAREIVMQILLHRMDEELKE